MNVNEALQCEDAPLASEMKCIVKFKGLMGYLQSYEAKRKLYQFALSLSRYVIECPNCAVIYRSRQYWYGNQDPVETVVRTEIQHVWPGVRTKKKQKKKPAQMNLSNIILLLYTKESVPAFLLICNPLHRYCSLTVS